MLPRRKLTESEGLAILNEFQREHKLTDAQLVDIVNTAEAETAKHNLAYLAQHVLGYSDLEPLHVNLCAVISSINPLIVSIASSATKADRGGGEGGGSVDTPTQNSTTFPTPTTNVTTNRPATDGLSTNMAGLSDMRFQRPRVGKEFEEYLTFSETSKQRLFLLFRGSFKTTLISIAHTIQLMLLYPDIRILIASHKKEGGSQEILKAIKAHFTQNKKFRQLFPEYCPKANEAGVIDWGTTEKVTLPNRSDTAIFPEATVEIAGVTTDVTGRHYDYIKADDLVTRESVTNEQMLAKTEEYNSLLKFLFNQPEWGILDYSGTPYHFADLYATLRENPDMTHVIIPVTHKDGTPTLPRRFSKEGIERIKNDPSMTSYTFSCQYSLNPVPEEDQTFRPEWWKRPTFYYDTLPDNLKFYIFIDPAARQKKSSDYTALITIGVDPKGDLYLTDIIRDKLDEAQRPRLVLDLCKKRNTHLCHYESIGFQSTDCSNLRRLSKEQNYYIEVIEIKASKASKEDRIRSLQPVYERGDIHWPHQYLYHSKYHNRTIDMVEVLKKELWMFPMAEYDDLADAHSFMTQIQLYKPSHQTPKDSPDTLDRIISTMIKKPDPPKTISKRSQQGFGRIPYREAPF